MYTGTYTNHSVAYMIFFNNCFKQLSPAWQLASQFLNVDISQGSAAIRCDRLFYHDFIANLLVSLRAKKGGK